MTTNTKQNFLITVTIDGVPYGEFETFTGGEITSTPSKWRGPSMGPFKQASVLPEYGDVTVGRGYDGDDQNVIRTLTPKVGRGESVVSKQLLDIDGQKSGTPKTYLGKLNSLTPGDADSGSGDPDKFTMTFQIRSVA